MAKMTAWSLIKWLRWTPRCILGYFGLMKVLGIPTNHQIDIYAQSSAYDNDNLEIGTEGSS